jgi:hypothetical protein
MKFNGDVLIEGLTNFLDFVSDPNKYQKFSFDFSEGFNSVPVLEQVRFHTDLLTNNDKVEIGEKLTRIMITGKPIEIFLENVSLGKIIVNGNTAWDAFPIILKFPSALNSLIEVCLGDFLGKYIPPLKNIVNVPVEGEKISPI